MKPTRFKESTKTLAAPNVRGGELPVFSNGMCCVSRWRPSLWERLRIAFGAPVWLHVWSGNSQPPVCVIAETPFVKPSPKTKLALFLYDLHDFVKDTSLLFSVRFRQADKRKHFFVGLAISVLFGLAWYFLGLPMPCAFGFLVGAMAGIVKEWWDSKGHGQVEIMDFVFTALGAFVAMPITYAIGLIRNLI